MDDTHEIRSQHLQVLGPELGAIYHALHREVVWLHAKWLEYRKLYGHSADRIDLLNDIAGFFFRVVHDVLWEDVLLHLARLTDSSKSMGKQNLTLKRLPAVIPEPALAAEVEHLVDTAIAACSFAKDWRNRRLAHRDLDLAVEVPQTRQLAEASRRKVEDALAAVSAVLNRLQQHYFSSEVVFRYFHAVGDAEALVYYLRAAGQAEERRTQRVLEGKMLPEDLEPPPEA